MRRRRRHVRWILGLTLIFVAVAAGMSAVRVTRQTAQMRWNRHLVLDDAMRQGGFTDGSARRVRVGGIVTSKDARCTLRVLEIDSSRVRVAVSLDSAPPETVSLPTPGAPIESIFLPGGFRARVLELNGDEAFILVSQRPSRG
jgi:cytochrome c-type biogenesis protein CcmE